MREPRGQRLWLRIFHLLACMDKYAPDIRFQRCSGVPLQIQPDALGRYTPFRHHPRPSLKDRQRQDSPACRKSRRCQGHDLKKFLARHPETASGCLGLQDLLGTLNGVKVGPVIQLQLHNFFTPQLAKSKGRPILFQGQIAAWLTS